MKKILIFILLVVMIFGSGCHSLRKKFVRKKKDTKETPVYINFKQYPQLPSRQAYVDYYLFVKGWLEDLVNALQDADSRKKEKRAVNEAIMNLEQIIYFYNQDGKENIYPLYEELLSVKGDIYKGISMNEIKRDMLAVKVDRIRRNFESGFNYNDAKQWIRLDFESDIEENKQASEEK